MSVQELFNFIVDQNVTAKNRDECLEKMKDLSSSRPLGQMTNQEKVDEEVFKNVYIPKCLDQVLDFERDFQQLEVGIKSEKDIPYRTILGLSKDLKGIDHTPSMLPQETSDSGGDGSADDEDTDEDNEAVEDGKDNKVTVGRPRGESPSSRKERKKVAKDAQAEKRKTKIKKHLKKRAEKEKRRKK